MARFKEVKPAVIRDRLRRARRLAGLTVTEAWKRMGYKSAGQISKMESETSTTPINYNFVLRAAKCYGVSTDYLFGLSNYDDADPKIVEQKAVLSKIEDVTTQLVEDLSEVILKSGQEISLKIQLEQIVQESEAVVSSFEKIRKLNPTFDDEIRNGANLVSTVNQLKDTIERAKKKISRLQYSQAVLRQYKEIRKEELNQPEFEILKGL